MRFPALLLVVAVGLSACGSPPASVRKPEGTEARAGEAATQPPATPSADAGSTAPSTPTPSAPSSDAATPRSSGAKAADGATRIAARHVLIQWMGAERAGTQIVRSREQALALAQEVLRRAKANEDFARLAVEYSDEPGAASRGGSLGRFGRGQMVGAFEAAAFKLEVGQISDIVESPFGYHIIQRTE